MIFRNKKIAQPSCVLPTQSAPSALGQGKTKNTASIKKSGGVFGFSLAFNALPLLLSSIFVSQNLYAATEANKVITNQATVSYQFLGQGNVASDSEAFITARNSDGSGTESVITLMHNSIDFSGQYQAAQASALVVTADALPQDSTQTSLQANSRSSRVSNLVASNTGTAASSDGVSITGSFPVNSGQCADATGNLNAQSTPLNYQGKELLSLIHI